EAQRTAEAERAEAEQARRRTREALDEVASEAIDSLLAQQKQLTPRHRAFLRKALAFYREFAEQPGPDAQTRTDVAVAHFRMGVIRAFLGEHRGAEEALTRATALWAHLADEFPAQPRYRFHLAACLTNTGNLHLRVGRRKQAEEVFRKALALNR